MYVSSYATYIHNDVKSKLQSTPTKELNNAFVKRLDKENSEEFSLSLRKQSIYTQLPLNYVSAYKSLNNQLRLKNQTLLSDQSEAVQKSKKEQVAQKIYSENKNMITNIAKPKPALQPFPIINTKLPLSSISAQEKIAKIKMINTYVSNENYYRAIAS